MLGPYCQTPQVELCSQNGLLKDDTNRRGVTRRLLPFGTKSQPGVHSANTAALAHERVSSAASVLSALAHERVSSAEAVLETTSENSERLGKTGNQEKLITQGTCSVSGEAGQPRPLVGQRRRSTSSTQKQNNQGTKDRNTNRGLRSENKIIERNIKRSIKRNLARRDHRKQKGGNSPPRGQEPDTKTLANDRGKENLEKMK